MTCRFSRRHFLASTAVALAAPPIFVRAAPTVAASGDFASFDQEVETFMRDRQVPGGSLAVVKQGRLVFARGYGWADRDKRIAAKADTLFRIASVSKPITATAVLKLVEDRKLALQTPALEAAGLAGGAAAGQPADPRMTRITLRHLLQHTAGWDRDKSGDPMFDWPSISKEFRVQGPPDSAYIIRHMLRRPLDFDPGQRYAYSNFGYCLLGRIIERVAGCPYETFVREQVLKPIGVCRMRIGGSLESAEGESCYYTANDKRGASVFPERPGRTPAPYGTFSMQAMDAHGGWVASVVDLARFAAAFDDPNHSPLLRPESLRDMCEPPPAPAWRNQAGNLEDAFYACGWMVRPVSDRGANYWHTGSLPGTSSLLVRRWDRLSWVVVFNQRSDNAKRPDGAIDGALHRAAGRVKDWPLHNLFSSYP